MIFFAVQAPARSFIDANRYFQILTFRYIIALCLVLVFYYRFSITVNNPHNVTLQIVDIAVYFLIKIDYCRTEFIIIEEVHFYPK